jgi:hypothetical protein
MPRNLGGDRLDLRRDRGVDDVAQSNHHGRVTQRENSHPGFIRRDRAARKRKSPALAARRADTT